jgi:iron complex outermembrane receptor protein
VRSIEVVKGPYALTWGAGNLSAIRVETQPLPQAETPLAGSLAVGYDANLSASEMTGKVYGKSGSTSYFLHGAFREGNDYESGNGTLVQADFESWEGRGKLGFDLSDHSDLEVSAGYQEQGPIDYQGRLLNAAFFESMDVSATYSWSGMGRVRGVEFQGYWSHVDHGMDNIGKPTHLPMDGRMPPFALDVTVDSEITVGGGRLAVDLHLDDSWSAEVGTDLYMTNRDAIRTIKNLETQMVMFEDLMWPDADINDLGVFGRFAWTNAGRRVAATVRGDFVSASAPTASDFFLANIGTDLDAAENNLSGALTVAFDLSSSWTLALGVGSVVRTADASERYSDRVPASKAQMAAEFVGNPKLDPERSTQGDVWLDGRFERFAVHLGGFVRRMDDYITIQPTDLPKRLPLSPPVVFQYVNGEADFRGIEASVSMGLSDEVTLDASGSYLYGQDTALDEPAIGVSPLRTSFGLRYEEVAGRYYVEGAVNLVGEQDRVAVSRGETPTDRYQTGDLRAGFGLANGVTIRTGVLNVWNEDYADHLNAKNPFTMIPVAEPGRVVFLDVAWSF